jgi:hypothetical protein
LAAQRSGAAVSRLTDDESELEEASKVVEEWEV